MLQIIIEPTGNTRRLMQELAHARRTNLARIVAEDIMREMANDPSIPHFEDDTLRTGWEITDEYIFEGAAEDTHFARVGNMKSMMPEDESLIGPRPYDIGLGVEYGHRGHWVAFAPKRLGRRVRTKLIRWIKARGDEEARARLAQFEEGDINAAVHVPDYAPRPFVRPWLQRYAHEIHRIEAAMRRWLEGQR